MSWLAYELTQQSTWTALIAAAQIAPTFVLGVWGGALADRWCKRQLIFATQAAFTVLAFALAWLVLSDNATPWALLIISLANGIVQAIDLPARLAFVMDLVGREDLTNAVGLNSVLFNLARTAGPAVAGIMLLNLSPGHCFLVNAISYIPILVGLWAMDMPRIEPHPARRKAKIWAGFKHLAEQPSLFFLVLLAGIVSLAAWPFLSLLPAFAADLGVREHGYSQMLSATGCGALLAALVVATFGSARQQRAFMASAVVLMSLSLVGLSFAPNLPLAVAACAVIGFGLILFFATSQSVVQLGAGEHNRGRVMGIWAMVLSGAVPLGNLLCGPAADRWGEPVVLFFEGIACGACALALLLIRSYARRAAR